jgi:hypothetical protein
MKDFKLSILCGFPLLLLFSCQSNQGRLSGELKTWETIALIIDGPETHEQAEPSPFLDYRLLVKFVHQNEVYQVRGFYAADGNAAQTGADSGNKWRVRFTPDAPGKWSYEVSFRSGKNIGVSDDPEEGVPLVNDGLKGSFRVRSAGKVDGKDVRSKGRLEYTGSRYLQYSGTQRYFIKGGADSPENFLGYVDFDGTHYNGDLEQRMGEAAPNQDLHSYLPHLQDWKEGDPTWKNGRGKGIIGALNYLASKGMNSVYFLTMNIQGDGRDVWPYTGYNERYRFDCSKLDQWEIVFSHMDNLGLMLHIVTQETENELLLDKGETGIQRKLYYLELISRFAHHLAITWNMGEENGYVDFSPKAQTREQQREMIRYMKEHDPYRNFVVLHTHGNPVYRAPILNDLLGYVYLDGPSLQLGEPKKVYRETSFWLKKSSAAGKPWVVCIDEIGPHWRGIDPDDRENNNQDSLRNIVLWANLMAGGGGVEWYFGYRNHDNDLSCEDWRSRDRVWDYTRFALDFFQQYLPFHEMEPSNELIDNVIAYCLAKPGEIYAIYIPVCVETQLDLSDQKGNFLVRWYDPRMGGDLQEGSVEEIHGGSFQNLGQPPSETGSDWVILVRKSE